MSQSTGIGVRKPFRIKSFLKKITMRFKIQKKNKKVNTATNQTQGNKSDWLLYLYPAYNVRLSLDG